MAELRLSIIELATIQQKPILATDTLQFNQEEEYHECIRKSNPLRYPPAFARTSSSLRKDVLTIYHRHNSFVAEFCHDATTEQLMTWLHRAGRKHRLLLNLIVEDRTAVDEGVEGCADDLVEALDLERFKKHEVELVEKARYRLSFHA